MKKFLVLLTLALALVLAGCGSGLNGITSLDTTNDDYKFDGLQAQINVINQALEGNDIVIKGIQDNVAALQAKCAADALIIADLQARVAALEAGEKNDVTQAQIDELKEQIAALQAADADINETIISMQTDITNLQIECGDVKVVIAGIQDNVAKNTGDIAALQAEVDRLCGRISRLSRAVCCLFSKLNALSARLDGLTGAVATFGLVPPTDGENEFKTGFYVDMSTGNVYQWVEGGWVGVGGFQLSPALLKAPMFVLAEKKSGNKVRITWTAVENAVGYEVYALQLCDGEVKIPLKPVRVAYSGAGGNITGLTVELGSTVQPRTVVPPVGPATSLTYVVVAIDAQGNAGASSYAVGPLTGNPHD
jgi:archaellum component FlaC